MNPLIAQAIELSNNQLAGGVIAVLATMIGQHFAFRKYIRDVAGVKETTTTEISGQPIKFSQEEKVMTEKAHQAVCGRLEKRVGDLETDMRGIKGQMATETKEILKAGHDRAEKIYDRINSIDRKVAALDERTDTTNSSLDVQSKKIDRLLERLKA